MPHIGGQKSERGGCLSLVSPEGEMSKLLNRATSTEGLKKRRNMLPPRISSLTSPPLAGEVHLFLSPLAVPLKGDAPQCRKGFICSNNGLHFSMIFGVTLVGGRSSGGGFACRLCFKKIPFMPSGCHSVHK